MCHNDVEPSNVVFRDGIAVALLDFEFAALGRPVYDVAQLARLCVPIAAARRSVDAGHPSAVAMWNRTGGRERYDRRRRWWTDHHDRFAAALL